MHRFLSVCNLTKILHFSSAPRPLMVNTQWQVGSLQHQDAFFYLKIKLPETPNSKSQSYKIKVEKKICVVGPFIVMNE